MPKTQDNQAHPQFLPVAQVASILNVSDVFIRRLLGDGLLSGVRLGSAKNSLVRITGRSLENLRETYTVTGVIYLLEEVQEAMEVAKLLASSV